MSKHRSRIVILMLSLMLVNVLPVEAQTVSGDENDQKRGYGLHFVVVELNCENLFDCADDTLKDDEAFLPEGDYRWTPKRYWKKQNNIAREILSCGRDGNGNFVIPDIVGLCEVENDSVMRDLTQRSLLRNAHYNYVVTDSPDARGVDVGLLYSPMTFKILNTGSIRIPPIKDMRPTRDILYVEGQTVLSDTLHIFVVHAPSRSGGEVETRKNRVHVTTILSEHIDSIRQQSPRANIIVMGDFNDYSGDKSLRIIRQHAMTEVSESAVGHNGAKGTYKYGGVWESLDHIFVSDSMADCVKECFVMDEPFLLETDDTDRGVKPRRNYVATSWNDGFSDHLPLVMRLEFQR